MDSLSQNFPHGNFTHLNSECTCSGKQCKKCEQIKCIDEFRNAKSREKYIRRTQCKICDNLHQRAYYAENKEHYRDLAANYNQSHKEEKRKYNALYGRQNRARLNEKRRLSGQNKKPEARLRAREWAINNPERTKARFENWKKSNWEYCMQQKRLHTINRRTRKTQMGGSHTLTEWNNLKALYNHTCLCCGKCEPEIKLTADHIIPVSKCGSSNIENIQPLCGPCNSAKFNRIVDYRPRQSFSTHS